MNKDRRAIAFLRDLSAEAQDPELFQRARWETQICESKHYLHFIIDCNYAELPTYASEEDFRKLRLTVRDPEESPVASLIGFTVLARALVSYTPFVLRALAELGGKNELTEQEGDRLDRWPLLICQEYLKRRVTIVKASQLPTIAPEYAVRGRVFAKTLRKMAPGWGAVSRLDEVVEALRKGLPYNAESPTNPKGRREMVRVRPDTEIVLSQPLALKVIAGTTLEYRACVVDSSVATILAPHEKEIELPQQVRQFATRFVHAHTQVLPKHYVLDVAVCRNGGIVVIELNSIVEAGLAVPCRRYKAVFEQVFERYMVP